MFTLTKDYSKAYRVSVVNSLKKLFKKLDNDFSPTAIYDNIKRLKLNEERSVKGLRNFFNYLENNNLVEKSLLDEYRSKIQWKQKQTYDVFVPKDEEVKKTLEGLKKNNYLQYICCRFLLETGCRLTEIEHFFKTFEERHITIQNNVVCYPLNFLRHNKQSYFLFFSRELYDLFLEHSQEMIDFITRGSQIYIKRNKLTPLKYFRKYQFTKMIEVGINFEIANFIQGRTSKNVGVNHYLAKKQVALKEYEKLKLFKESIF
ncbi:MAG: hypothetical protein KC589_02620 [Nanoarchaeota archaeon]|nr:hypothetical protein [Nanoarchaeota archaeon]